MVKHLLNDRTILWFCWATIRYNIITYIGRYHYQPPATTNTFVKDIDAQAIIRNINARRLNLINTF